MLTIKKTRDKSKIQSTKHFLNIDQNYQHYRHTYLTFTALIPAATVYRSAARPARYTRMPLAHASHNSNNDHITHTHTDGYIHIL